MDENEAYSGLVYTSPEAISLLLQLMQKLHGRKTNYGQQPHPLIH